MVSWLRTKFQLFMQGFTMWLLLIVLLAPPSGIDRVTVLNTFATYEDCQPERIVSDLKWRKAIPMTVTFASCANFERQNPRCCRFTMSVTGEVLSS